MFKDKEYLKLLLYIAPLALALSACGGGSGDGGGDNPNPDPDPDSSNRAPTAQDISVQSDLSSPYISIKLVGSDPDNDTISYVLDAPNQGAGFERAFVDPNQGYLYTTLTNDGTDNIVIAYKVSDGSLYSATAEVTVSIGELTGC
ncbi:MAG: hypothetical protein ABW095_06420 [Candidatus Thiodiazotropha sp.]